jgi:alpha-L-fucosidase
MKKSIVLLFIAISLLFSSVQGQTLTGDELKSMEKSALTFGVKESQNNPFGLSAKVIDKWQDLKFGMFIHWGLYAINGRGEWAMFNEKISTEEYAKLAQQFNPQSYDAKLWASIAKKAGMKYMVLTTRHHDGFALWNSPASYNDFNTYETASKRDFVSEYTKACRQAGLKVGLYYSPMDWRFPGYFNAKELPENAGLMKTQAYGQLEELMSNYGKVDILWYDGGWLAHKGSDADAAWLWEPVKLNTMVRELQPKVIFNPRSGVDGNFICNEGGAPLTGPIVNTPWEKCLTLNRNSWGFNFNVNNMTAAEVVNMLVNTVDRGGNMLLNVGPDANGVIPPAQVEILEQVGRWMNVYGQSIYGTNAGPFQPVDGVYGSVNKGNKIFIHLLKNDGKLVLPPLDKKILACSQLNGSALNFSQNKDGITIETSNLIPNESVITLVLKFKK